MDQDLCFLGQPLPIYLFLLFYDMNISISFFLSRYLDIEIKIFTIYIVVINGGLCTPPPPPPFCNKQQVRSYQDLLFADTHPVQTIKYFYQTYPFFQKRLSELTGTTVPLSNLRSSYVQKNLNLEEQ